MSGDRQILAQGLLGNNGSTSYGSTYLSPNNMFDWSRALTPTPFMGAEDRIPLDFGGVLGNTISNDMVSTGNSLEDTLAGISAVSAGSGIDPNAGEGGLFDWFRDPANSEMMGNLVDLGKMGFNAYGMYKGLQMQNKMLDFANREYQDNKAIMTANNQSRINSQMEATGSSNIQPIDWNSGSRTA